MLPLCAYSLIIRNKYGKQKAIAEINKGGSYRLSLVTKGFFEN